MHGLLLLLRAAWLARAWDHRSAGRVDLATEWERAAADVSAVLLFLDEHPETEVT